MVRAGVIGVVMAGILWSGTLEPMRVCIVSVVVHISPVYSVYVYMNAICHIVVGTGILN